MRPVRWTRKRGSLPAYAVLVGLTLAGGALQGQTGMVVRGNPAEGRRLFEERGCVRCHSIWGNGGVLGPDFAVVGAGRTLDPTPLPVFADLATLALACRPSGGEIATPTPSPADVLASVATVAAQLDRPAVLVRTLADGAPSLDLLLIYRAAGREAVAAGNVALADPKNKIPRALSALIDAAVADIMASLKAELAK